MSPTALRRHLERDLDHAVSVLHTTEAQSRRKSYTLGATRAEVRILATALTLLRMDDKDLWPGYQQEIAKAVKRTGHSILGARP